MLEASLQREQQRAGPGASASRLLLGLLPELASRIWRRSRGAGTAQQEPRSGEVSPRHEFYAGGATPRVPSCADFASATAAGAAADNGAAGRRPARGRFSGDAQGHQPALGASRDGGHDEAACSSDGGCSTPEARRSAGASEGRRSRGSGMGHAWKHVNRLSGRFQLLGHLTAGQHFGCVCSAAVVLAAAAHALASCCTT